MVGFAVATYLALFRYGVVDTVWEPYFGDGSATVLDSELSRVLPVSDGALGAAAYLADAVTGALFGVRRWRTQPWIVVVFGVAVGPLGLISVLLVIAQPVLYAHAARYEVVRSLRFLGVLAEVAIAGLVWVGDADTGYGVDDGGPVC
jgi:hypothetical protein